MDAAAIAVQASRSSPRRRLSLSQVVNACHGYTQLAAMTFAFELRDEYG